MRGLGNSFVNDGIVTGNDKGNEADHLIWLEAWQCEGTHGSVGCPALRDLWIHKISPLIVNKEAKATKEIPSSHIRGRQDTG